MTDYFTDCPRGCKAPTKQPTKAPPADPDAAARAAYEEHMDWVCERHSRHLYSWDKADDARKAIWRAVVAAVRKVDGVKT